jgi:thiamine phosphate phosphatase / amino-HMP aminohydrolase
MSMYRRFPDIQLILDWDGTLTTSDTLSTLAKIGYSHHDVSTPWAEIVGAYLADFHRHAEQYVPKKEDRVTIAEESAWLASLDATELASWHRVQIANVFGGIGNREIKAGAENAVRTGAVTLRPGWEDLIRLVYVEEIGDMRKGLCAGILSVNWSGQFIWDCLVTAMQQPEPPSRLKVVLRANELHLPLHNRLPIRTSADKLRELRNHFGVGWERSIFKELDVEASQRRIFLYVGDSATDFDSLLAADVGICIRDDPMSSGQAELASAFERVKVPVNPLAELTKSIRGASADDKKQSQERPALWWTTRLEEITEMIQSAQ